MEVYNILKSVEYLNILEIQKEYLMQEELRKKAGDNAIVFGKFANEMSLIIENNKQAKKPNAVNVSFIINFQQIGK